MTPPKRPLEPSPDEMRRVLAHAAERVVRHIETLPEQPATDVAGAEDVARELKEPMPVEGRPVEELVDVLFERVIPKSFNTAGPGYLAFIPGGGLFESAVAGLISDATNRFVGIRAPAPALAQLEATVVRWFADMVGLPAAAGGVLTSGGSIANLIAVVTARRDRLPDDFLRGTLYVSDQSHHSVEKAAAIAGFPAANVRSVPTDDAYRVRVADLRRAVEEDREAGMTPFLVVANAGTTNTGAVDDLAAVADVARDHGLWFHADAAYGGFFMLTDRGRAALRGIERADSVTLDPHKGLFLPFGTGCILARDLQTLRRAHAAHGDYLVGVLDEDHVNFADISPELTRGARGLRAWLPLKAHGVGAFRDELDEKLDLARWAADEVRRIPHVEMLAEPELSTLAFRVAPDGMSEGELNALNQGVLAGVNARKRVFLSATTLRGGFALRLTVLSFRTHLDRVRMAVEDVRAAAEDALTRAR